ncbi:MAG: c-type cytochrome, partial [Planctomycetaceae bacterium]|nr:c-type cytochrome [Planctomycetaceae bacterium]
FITGTPLPLTDVVVNPHDGAMYFTIGGRRVQSGLYRVTYDPALATAGAEETSEPTVVTIQDNGKVRVDGLPVAGDEHLAATLAAAQPTFVSLEVAPNITHGAVIEVLEKVTALGVAKVTLASVESVSDAANARGLRRTLEQLHRPTDGAVEQIWPHLSSEDRAIRYAARVALEHQDPAGWRERALSERNPRAALTALMALARTYRRGELGEPPMIDTPIPDWNHLTQDADRAAITSRVLESISQLPIDKLSHQQKLDTLRVLTLTFLRIGPPNADERTSILEHLESSIPAATPELNSELAQLVVYLQAPWAATKLVPLVTEAPTQEEQIDLARSVRHLRVGWTPELQQQYFEWCVRALSYRGGASFGLFVENIRNDAIALLSDADRERMKELLEARPASDQPAFTATPRRFVREWKMDELVPLIESGLQGRDFDHGRKMFAAASCFACHRFDNQGGAVGPDLTILSGRFSPRDILESIVEPSKVISDQYGSVQIVTVKGEIVHGRIINLAGDSFRIQTDMLNPSALVSVDRKQIEEMIESKTSMMPVGLLNTLEQDEVLDLLAYLLSRGDRNHPMF